MGVGGSDHLAVPHYVLASVRRHFVPPRPACFFVVHWDTLWYIAFSPSYLADLVTDANPEYEFAVIVITGLDRRVCL